ncbi:MAG TPA: hypothetical protein PLP61_14405, partial [Nocardioides sp.]|uniref:hypothetical protein n=1 Tax=Nocardioides sp. TaxID=35761 RepID=UPI002CD80FCD
MEWVVVAVVVGVVVSMVLSRQQRGRAAQERAAEELDRLRRTVEEDVTRYGEELGELHVDTLTTELDAAMRQDYQRALDSYENAKTLLRDARVPEDVTPVTRTLEDGRYALACVRARAEGQPLPTRRPPCFFNPAHGPAQTDVAWAPPGGAPREVPVCLADADRLAQGAEPDVRQVRRGNEMVPWFRGGPAYGPYAGGYYGGYAMSGLFPGILIGSMLGMPAGDVSGGAGEDWSGDPAADSAGDAGGGDFGGGDAGCGDFGG